MELPLPRSSLRILSRLSLHLMWAPVTALVRAAASPRASGSNACLLGHLLVPVCVEALRSRSSNAFLDQAPKHSPNGKPALGRISVWMQFLASLRAPPELFARAADCFRRARSVEGVTPPAVRRSVQAQFRRRRAKPIALDGVTA